MSLRRRNPRLPGDRAEVGVGTLIIFIGMLLVASVAASVLLHTMGGLQEIAQRTGEDATRQVSTNLVVRGVYGNVTDGRVTNVTLHLGLAAGAPPTDLSTLRIRYADGTNPGLMLEQTNTADPTCALYRTLWKRGDATDGVMEPGDLVAAVINLGDCGHAYKLGPRAATEVRLIPENGAQLPADFRTPNTYAGKSYVILR